MIKFRPDLNVNVAIHPSGSVLTPAERQVVLQKAFALPFYASQMQEEVRASMLRDVEARP